MQISNDEVSGHRILPILWLTEVYTLQIADMLPSKTVPEINNGKKQICRLKLKVKVMATAPLKKKVRAHSVEAEEIEDEDSTHNIAMQNSGISLTSSFEIPDTKKVSQVKSCITSWTFLFNIGVFRRALAET
jgi:hypothetical protein